MIKLSRQISALLLIILLFTTIIASSGFALKDNKFGLFFKDTKQYTIYRYGPDRSIVPISVDLHVEDKDDIEKALMEKCSELVINDEEMQNFLSKYVTEVNLTNISLWSHIQSWGIGEHWKSVFRFRIPLFVLLRFKLFQDVPLRFKMFGINVIPWIHCNYMNDENAKTTIGTLPIPIRQNQTISVIEGKHNVTSVFFFGYSFWKTSQAIWFDENKISTGFDGYSFLTWITRPYSEN